MTPAPKNVSWRLVALGLLLGGLVAGGALALTWPDDAPAPAQPEDEDPHADAMDADARCAHMPEHCEEGAR